MMFPAAFNQFFQEKTAIFYNISYFALFYESNIYKLQNPSR